MDRICSCCPNESVCIRLRHNHDGLLSRNRVLAAHLRLDAIGSVFAPCYMVTACDGCRGGPPAFSARIYRCSLLWTKCKHAVGHRHGIGQMPLDRGSSLSRFGFAFEKDRYPKRNLELTTTEFRESVLQLGGFASRGGEQESELMNHLAPAPIGP